MRSTCALIRLTALGLCVINTVALVVPSFSAASDSVSAPDFLQWPQTARVAEQTQHVETNGERFQQGLGPLPPQPSKTRALYPRLSPAPKKDSNSQWMFLECINGGTVAVSYDPYTATSLQAAVDICAGKIAAETTTYTNFGVANYGRYFCVAQFTPSTISDEKGDCNVNNYAAYVRSP